MPSVADLVIQSSTSTGTGNFTLASLASGSPPYFYRNFSDAFGTGAGNTFYYCIRNQAAAEFEVGVGYMSSATVMVRLSVLRSSNANALVNFSAGVKDVICDMPADYQQVKPINHGGTSADTADGAVANLISGLTTENSVDAASPRAIYGYWHNSDNQAYYVDGDLLREAIIAGTGFGSLAFQNTVNLGTQVTGTLTEVFGGYRVYDEPSVAALSGQVVSGFSTYTWSIPLNASDFTHGIIQVMNVDGGTFPYNTGVTAIIGTATSDNYGWCANVNYVYASYVSTVLFRSVTVHTNLTGNSCFGNGTFGDVRINSIRINGSNIDIIFGNSVGVNRTINARAQYRLGKGTVQSA